MRLLLKSAIGMKCEKKNESFREDYSPRMSIYDLKVKKIMMIALFFWRKL